MMRKLKASGAPKSGDQGWARGIKAAVKWPRPSVGVCKGREGRRPWLSTSRSRATVAALGAALVGVGLASPAMAQFRPSQLYTDVVVDQNSTYNVIELGWSGSVDDSIDEGIEPSCWFAGGSPVGTLHNFYFQHPATYVQYTPPAGWTGTTSFQYHCGNAFGNSLSPGTATITVRAVAVRPTASNVSASTGYNQAVTFNASTSGEVTRLYVGHASQGTAAVSGLQLRYTPPNGFYGQATFAYSAEGPGGRSADAIATVTVAPPPAPGAAAVSTSTAYQTAKSIPLSPSGVYDRLAIVSNGSRGTATISGTTATYTPRAGEYGQDSFTYRAEGPGGNSSAATVTITIGAPPAPTAGNMTVDVGYQTRTAITPPSSGVANSISVDTRPSNGSADWFYPTITYTPAAGFYGNDSLTYRINGPGGSSPTYTVTLRVAPPPAPTAANATVSVPYETRTYHDLPVGGDWTSVNFTTNPAHGGYSISGRTLNYIPNTGFYGTDSFTYHSKGPGGQSAPATVTLNVAPPPAPGASDASVSVPHNTKTDFSVSLSGVWTGMEIVSWPPNAASLVHVGNTFGYTPNTGFYGTDSFTYRATGPGGNSPTRTVTVTVGNPSAPGAGNVSASTAYQTAVAIPLTPSGVYTSVSKVADPSNGSVSISGTTATYTPNGGFSGTDSFTYRATGPGGDSPTRTVTVTVGSAPLPPAPEAGNVYTGTAYQTARNISLPVSGVYTSVSKVADPANGSVSISGTTATYTPAAGFYGTDSFTYRATGPGGNSPTATVMVDVGNPPAPGAGAVSASTAYQTAVAIPLTPSGVYTSVSKVSDPSNGTVSISGTTATYTPASGFYGADSFTYRATGPGGSSPTRTVTITVNYPSFVAYGDDLTTAYETPLQHTVRTNGYGSANSYRVATPPAHGSASVTNTGEITYTPAPGFYGTDSFVLQVVWIEGFPQSAGLTFNITVGKPPAPAAAGVIANVPFETLTTFPHGATGEISGVTIVSQPSFGTAAVVAGELTYQPNAGFYGADSFTYRATGPGGNSAAATVSVTVGLPPAPTAADASLAATFEKAQSTVLPVGGVLTEINIISQPSHGTAAVVGTTLTYTPAADYVGSDSLTYNATGPGGASDTHTVSITVAAPALPTVAAATLAVPYETAGSVQLTATGVKATITVDRHPDHGSVTISGTTATYEPDPLYYGADSFTVISTNVAGSSAPATVSVTVGLPPAPTVAPASLTTPYEAPGSITLTATGIYSGFTLATQPAHGTAVLAGNVVTYTPAALHYGADSFTYTATGPGGASTPATVSVSVGLPGAPAVAGGSITTPYETAGAVQLTVTGVYSRLEIVDAPLHGAASISDDRVIYTPNALHYGADSLTVRAVGPGGLSDPATVSVTVGNPPAPTLAPASITTAYETTGSVDLVGGGVFTTFEIAAQPSFGSASISGDRVIYTPNALHYGVDSLTVRAVGPGGRSAPATVTVDVGLPPPPVVTDRSLATAYETPGAVTLTATGRSTAFALDTSPTHGTATLAGAVATYTPKPGYYGADAFTFTATGPGGVSAPATVTVTVGLPGRPVASPDSISTPYETAGTVTLRATGVFDDFQFVTPPTHGTATIAGAVVTYTPDAGYFGADSFTFTATGPGGVSAPATVGITVGLPAAPTIIAPPLTTAYESAGSVDLTAAGIFTGFEIVEQPAHGSAVLAGNRVTYTPAALHYGADAMRVRAVGPGGASAPAVLAITVGLPPAPGAANTALTANYGTAATTKLAPSGVYTTLEVVDAPKHGTAAISGENLTFTPSSGYSGADALTYRAVGPGGVSAPATVSVTVGLPNAPTATAASISTAYETAGSVQLAGTGVFDAFALDGQPAHGTATLNGDVVTYTPAAGYYGSDAFTFTVSGPGGVSAPATVSVTVGLPALATVRDVQVTTPMDVAAEFALDAAGVYSALEVAVAPENGTVTIEGTTATYVPAAAFFGTDTFSYVAVSPAGKSEAATVTVTVEGGPPPEAEDMEKTGLSGEPIVFDVTQGLPGGPFTAIRLIQDGDFTSNEASGRVEVQGLRVIFTPAAGWTGNRTFRIAVENRFGWSEPARITAIVNPRPVTGGTIEVETWAGRPVEVDLTQNAGGGPFISAQLLSAPSDLAEVVLVSAAARHTIRVTPKGADGGVVEVRYTLANAFAVSAEGLVRVTIKERPDPSRNVEVTGLINAQTQSAYRFSAGQVSNVMRRLESIHGDQIRRNNVGLSLVPMEYLEALPGDNPISDRQRDYMIAAGMAEHVGRSQGEVRPGMGGANRKGNVSWWANGAIDLGFHRKGEDREGFNFTTDGLTAGADFDIGSKLVLGGGVGYGRDNSRIGLHGTESQAEAFSGFVYGSWQPRRGAFVDGVFGYTDMAFKAVRWSEEADAHLLSERDGKQLFGAVSAGWEHRGRRLYVSPYGRVEFANVTLGGFTESEAGLWSLEFEEQKSTRVIAALGVHGDYLFRWRSGDLSPTFRAEYRHELKNSGSAAIRYADWDDSPRYVTDPSAYDDRNLVLGAGVKWESVGGSRFLIEFEASAFNHTTQSGRWQVSYTRKY